MKTNRESCEVCKAPLFEPYRLGRRLVQTCPNCFTDYYTNGTVDNTNTRVSPVDCQHRARTMLISHRGSMNFEVSLCGDCGQFFVLPSNGQEITFSICGHESVTAANKFNELLFGNDAFHRIWMESNYELEPEYEPDDD